MKIADLSSPAPSPESLGPEPHGSEASGDRRSNSIVLIALGSNLPWGELQPRSILKLALEKLTALGDVEAHSGFWRTQSWPNPEDPPFLNLVVRLRAGVEPAVLLAAAHEIETSLGRDRAANAPKNAPRTLDIDLIDACGRVIASGGSEAGLILPHPRMHERAFVLAPLLDVAPGWVHPHIQETAETLFRRLPAAERASIERAAPDGAL